VWILSKDMGIDLLITDKWHIRSVSLQVKFSKDFMPTHASSFPTDEVKILTWFQFSPEQLSSSTADYWVLVLHSYLSITPTFLVIPPKQIFKQITKHCGKTKRLNMYFAVTSFNQCWDIRGLNKPEMAARLINSPKNKSRNFTNYLNNWTPIQQIQKC